MQHALTIRTVALTVVILSVGVGATSYLGENGGAQDAAAQLHVRAAVNAAMAWYQDPYGGHGSYRRLDPAGLVQEAPVISRNVRITVLAGGRAYCLADVEAQGHSAYYLGGTTHALTDLAGAVPDQVTLVRSTVADAASVCAAVR